MSNTSATGGYLQPTQSPVYGVALDTLLQQAIVNLSGLAGDLVRPRWQPRPPKMPPLDTDWCAVGVQNISRAWGTTETVGLLIRHEEIETLCSFYGPNADGLAALTQDNVAVGQNFDLLEEQGLFYRRAEDIVPMPELVNDQWQKRYDLALYWGRKVVRDYTIETIETAQVELYNDVGIPPTHIEVKP